MSRAHIVELFLKQYSVSQNMPSCYPWQKKLLRNARTAHSFILNRRLWRHCCTELFCQQCDAETMASVQWIGIWKTCSRVEHFSLIIMFEELLQCRRPKFLPGKSTAIRECCFYVWQASSATLFSWIVNNRVHYCGKGLASPLSSLYFASEEPEFVVTFPLVLSNSSPGVLKVFQRFALDIGWFFTHFQSIVVLDHFQMNVLFVNSFNSDISITWASTQGTPVLCPEDKLAKNQL